MIEVPYVQTLRDIRKCLAQAVDEVWGEDQFPCGACEEASSAVESILGLPGMNGMFTADVEGDAHNWNNDPGRGLYIDITMNQFIRGMEDVVVLPENTAMLQAAKVQTPCRPDQEVMERFKELYSARKKIPPEQSCGI